MTWDIPPFVAQQIRYPSASSTHRLRTLVWKLRPSGRPRGTSPQRDSCDRSGSERPRKRQRVTSPTFSETILTTSNNFHHPWISEIRVQHKGIFMDSPPLPSRMEISPFLMYFHTFPMKENLRLLSKSSYISNCFPYVFHLLAVANYNGASGSSMWFKSELATIWWVKLLQCMHFPMFTHISHTFNHLLPLYLPCAHLLPVQTSIHYIFPIYFPHISHTFPIHFPYMFHIFPIFTFRIFTLW